MKHIRIIYITLLLFVSLGVSAQSNLPLANDHYSKGEFTQAIELYEQTLTEEGESAELYYNLGNAYFKSDQLSKAILNYERALLLSPNFADAKFNLEIARQKVVDKIEPIGEFFLNNWMTSFRQLLPSNGWAVWSIVLFVLTLLALFVYFFTRRMAIKKLGFFAALFSFLLCLLFNVNAFNQKEAYTAHDRAVISAATVSIKSTPDAGGLDLFILHEGTVVAIKSKLGEWSEIELADGNVGWIKHSDLEII